jgi:predicted Zn-dependent protease
MKYREALDRYYYKKRTMVIERIDDARTNNFQRAKPVRSIAIAGFPEMDKAYWEGKIKAFSLQFRKYPYIMDPYVQIRGQFSHKLFVNSEGSVIAQPFTYYTFLIVGWVINNQGRYLRQSISKNFTHIDSFSSNREIYKLIRELAGKLERLRKAPELAPYSGPALLSPETAGIFFHEAIGHRLEGERLLDASEGQTFRDKIGELILPSFLSVHDDPLMERFGDKGLFGFYEYDDEGIRGERVTLVKNGILKGFLLSRKAPKPFRRSNGHGRCQFHQEPVSRMSNLIVSTNMGYSDRDLKEMLQKEVRRQGKPERPRRIPMIFRRSRETSSV